jgi:glucose-6-phosphate isomerase
LIKYHQDTTPDTDSILILEEYLNFLNQMKDSQSFEVLEDFIFHPEYSQEFDNVQNKVANIRGNDFDFIIFIGIGGANLGVKTVYDALSPEKEIIFFENIDPEINFELLKLVELRYSRGEKAVLIIASKSGNTTETMANFAKVFSFFQEIEVDWKERSFVTTTHGSTLDKIATTNEIEVIYTPDKLVDRYSVFGIGSIFALALAGIDTRSLAKGAQEANSYILTNNSPIVQMAVWIYNLSLNGLAIHNTFIFSGKLETFGRWQRQLMAESLGKNSQGITPIYSIGTTDLHSMTQLYLDGPRNISTNFITIENFPNDMVSDIKNILEGTPISKISDKTFGQLLSIVSNAVKTAYDKQNLPYTETILPTLDAYTLGELMQSSMLLIVLLGKLMGVNPFDQEAVELYKKEIANLL